MITVRQLIGAIVCRDEFNDLVELAQAYRSLAESRQDELIRIREVMDTEIEQIRLQNARNLRSLIEKFFIAADDPQAYEGDIRDELLSAHADLSDEIARLEEHAPT